MESVHLQSSRRVSSKGTTRSMVSKLHRSIPVCPC